jgi:hypothetical protein
MGSGGRGYTRVVTSVEIVVLGVGAVLSWRRAAGGPPLSQPAAFLACLLVAGVLAPYAAALALYPAGRPYVVPAVLAVFVATGLAACARPCNEEPGRRTL